MIVDFDKFSDRLDTSRSSRVQVCGHRTHDLVAVIKLSDPACRMRRTSPVQLGSKPSDRQYTCGCRSISSLVLFLYNGIFCELTGISYCLLKTFCEVSALMQTVSQVSLTRCSVWKLDDNYLVRQDPFLFF